jgi:hypothetical protein
MRKPSARELRGQRKLASHTAAFEAHRPTNGGATTIS